MQVAGSEGVGAWSLSKDSEAPLNVPQLQLPSPAGNSFQFQFNGQVSPSYTVQEGSGVNAQMDIIREVFADALDDVAAKEVEESVANRGAKDQE